MTWQATPPVGPTLTASVSIGSGASATLIPASMNKIGLWIQSLLLSSGANAASIGSSFLVEDTITDSASNQYVAVEIGLPTTGGTGHNTSPASPPGTLVPAGAALIVNNGGAAGTGALRRCSATVECIVLQSD